MYRDPFLHTEFFNMERLAKRPERLFLGGHGLRDGISNEKVF